MEGGREGKELYMDDDLRWKFVVLHMLMLYS